MPKLPATEYQVVNGIGIIRCQNPKVNQLSLSLREGLVDGLTQANRDSSVKAVVIVAGNRTQSFPAGADVTLIAQYFFFIFFIFPSIFFKNTFSCFRKTWTKNKIKQNKQITANSQMGKHFKNH